MSSRVQKGGTLFRPVVKSRPKTGNNLSRQPSASVEQLRTESTPEVSLVEEPQPLQTQIQDQLEPVLIQQLQAETGNSFGRSSVVPEERYVNPRPPVLPPPVGASIIGIPQRPVRSVPIVVPVRNIPDPQSSTHPIAVGPSTTNTLSVDSAPKATTSLGPASDETTATVPNAGSSSELSTDTASAIEPTEPPPTISPIDTSNTLEENPKETSKRRKSHDDGPKRPKRRKSVQKGEGAEYDQNTAPKRPRSRASSSTPRPRKKAPSPPPYDPDADPGEDIDPTTVTMASLCSDTGQGRVSKKAAEILSNHAAWKVKNREKRARMKMMMEAKKYGREEEEAELEAESAAAQENNSRLEEGSSTPQTSAAIADDTGNGFDYSEGLTTSRFNVQVRIGPNGETVIDENSLVVDRVEDDGTENYTHVIESDHTKFVNSGTYGKRYRGSRWSAEETELFYDALAQYGENYELIAYVLPGRDRKSCKNKFKVEDKRNHARINHCLDNSIPVDMKTLSRMTGKDFSGPVPEIRALTPLPLIPPNEETTEKSDERSGPSVKRRSRSKSHGLDSGLMVVGDAENFES